MFKKIKTIILDKLGIPDIQHKLESLNQQNAELQNRLEMVESEIRNTIPALQHFTKEFKDFCTIDLDIYPPTNACRGNNTIILTGVYKSKGFVRFYDLNQSDFENFIEQVQHLKKYGSVRNIDTPFMAPQFLSHFNLT